MREPPCGTLLLAFSKLTVDVPWQRVVVMGKRKGIVRFFGPTEYGPGVRVYHAGLLGLFVCPVLPQPPIVPVTTCDVKRRRKAGWS